MSNDTAAVERWPRNRLLRLQLIGAVRSLRRLTATVRDTVALLIVALIALIIVLSAWSRIWDIPSSTRYLAGSVLTAPIAFFAVRSMRHHKLWVREHGLLSRDALNLRTWHPYEAAAHTGMALIGWIPAAILTAHLSGRPMEALFSCILVSGFAAAAATLSSTGRAQGQAFEPHQAHRHVFFQKRSRDIALARRLGGRIAHPWGWLALLVSGFGAGLAPLIASAAGSSSSGALAVGTAATVVPLIWLTRLDFDLHAGMSLAGIRPASSAWNALLPAVCFACAATSAAACAAGWSDVSKVAALLPIGSITVLAIVYLERSWRLPKLNRRAADMLACGDLALITLTGVMMLWLAPVVTLVLLWRLHRRATAELLLS